MLRRPCSFYRDSGSVRAGRGVGYCDLDNRPAVCDGDLSFCEKPSDLKNHQDQQRGENPRDRRYQARFDLDLPMEYQALGTLKALGGIAIDGSEEGLLIFSTKEMFVGAMLKITIFFPTGYALDSLEVKAEITHREEGLTRKGYEYALRIVRVGQADLKKLRGLLSGRLAQEEASREYLLELSAEA